MACGPTATLGIRVLRRLIVLSRYALDLVDPLRMRAVTTNSQADVGRRRIQVKLHLFTYFIGQLIRITPDFQVVRTVQGRLIEVRDRGIKSLAAFHCQVVRAPWFAVI